MSLMSHIRRKYRMKGIVNTNYVQNSYSSTDIHHSGRLCALRQSSKVSGGLVDLPRVIRQMTDIHQETATADTVGRIAPGFRLFRREVGNMAAILGVSRRAEEGNTSNLLFEPGVQLGDDVVHNCCSLGVTT